MYSRSCRQDERHPGSATSARRRLSLHKQNPEFTLLSLLQDPAIDQTHTSLVLDRPTEGLLRSQSGTKCHTHIPIAILHRPSEESGSMAVDGGRSSTSVRSFGPRRSAGAWTGCYMFRATATRGRRPPQEWSRIEGTCEENKEKDVHSGC
ncbi:hypothetical protein BS50DRAFT_573695 [Corynespora cassiicola Philippines]|uniref:Uncharacterized protein n=1 Tax=Corynespora cassiicola Philippines TaxID=1448308 RepID=A0A2T2NPB5_CORCC|nr:hypothetical protein BS50DRAFT_573695 [Corynespora cassiicola Philippines]